MFMSIPLHTPISILDTGTMSAALGARLAAAGFPVMFGSHNPEDALTLAGTLGRGVWGGSLRQAAAFGQLIILETTLKALPALITATGNLSGKVVLDLSNNLHPDTVQRARPQTAGHPAFTAEEIVTLAPGARVVKALNFLVPEVLEQPNFAGLKPDVYFCGDDDAANSMVEGVMLKLGLEPMYFGPLSSAGLLESLHLIQVNLIEFSGFGPDSAFKLLCR